MSKIWTRLCSRCTLCSPSHSTEHSLGNNGFLRLKSRLYFTHQNYFREAPAANQRRLRLPNVFLLVRYAVRLIHRMAGLQPTLETLGFNNLALKSLPVDPNIEKTQRQVPGACFSIVSPTPVLNPSLVCMSLSAIQLLDLSEQEACRPEFVQYFCGNKILPGSETAAHCYCGHQFGYFSGQLGDGAAVYLGEIVNRKGERWEIQLKGAGLTPYSRTADGRKVLRSSIREFLCSEAMYHLGIPTTRAVTCITSDSKVIRDIFYDGHPIQERCTIVLRIAGTFLRFGSFEIFKPTDEETGRAGPSVGRMDILTRMLDYTVENFYPEIWREHSERKTGMYIEFYKEVVRGTARLVAEWQSVGWCHGVLNTDNMSIACVTIDYGPYGFMDKFDPDYICNGSDDGGRYSYQRQPEMCRWNCMKLAEAVQGVVSLSETLPHLDLFDEEYGRHYKMKIRRKLGLQKELPEDGALVQNFLDCLQNTEADFTNCFRCLSNLPFPSIANFSEERAKLLNYLLSQSSSLEELKKANQPRMDKRQLAMFMMVAQTNPELLSALGRSTQLLEREMERMSKVQDLEEATEGEVNESNKKTWSKWLDKYEERLKKEEEGVEDLGGLLKQRVTVMNSTNPRFILRNYIAENAIRAAENGDYSQVQEVLKLLESPYSDNTQLGVPSSSRVDSRSETFVSPKMEGGASSHVDHMSYEGKPPSWAAELRVT